MRIQYEMENLTLINGYLEKFEMKIIFLDIDGVLNCHNSKSDCNGRLGIDEDKVKRLKKIAGQQRFRE